MSFFTDLFEGNFSNLGTDLSHTFSSLASHPDQLAETLGVGALVAAPFVLPELGAAFGIGAAGDVAAGAADIGAGALADSATALADVGATDLGALGADAAAGAFDVGGAGAFDLGSAAAFNLDPAIASYLGSDVGAFGADAATALADTGGDFSSIINAADATAAAGGDVPSWLANTEMLTAPDAGFGATAAGAATPTAGTTALADTSGQFLTMADTAGPGIGADVMGAPGVANAASGGGITGALGSALSSPWTKLALAGAPLALTLGMGQPQLPASAQSLQNQAQQLQTTGLQNLADAQAGKLNAGQTAQIAQMHNDLMNQWLQTLANQGVQDPTKDTRWPQILADIDAKVTAQTATLIQQNITNALAETGQASSALISIAQMQMQSDTNFTNSLIGATKALGLAAGLSGSRTVTISG